MTTFTVRTMRGAALFILVAFGALATGHATAGAETPAQLAQGKYDEATIDRFVTAAREVVALRREYEPRLRAAPSQEAAKKLVDEARVRMNTAIENAGLTVERYTEIGKTVQQDPTLRARMEALVGTQ